MKQNRRTLRRAVVFVCLVIVAAAWIAGCRPAAEAPMRIGMNIWPGYEPLFLARHAGRLHPDRFRLIEFSDSSGVGRSFRNGTLEAACLTLDEVLYTIQDGLDSVVVLVLDQSHGADVVLANPEIRSLAELKHRRIAVEVSAVETYMLTRALQQANLTLADVTPVYLPIEKHEEAYRAGTVDAVVTFEPVRSRILAQGAVNLFNSAQIPGEIVDVLVVRRDYLARHGAQIAALRAAWFAALDQMHRNPHESAAIMAKREQLTADEFERSLSGLKFPDKPANQTLLGGATPQLLATADRLKSVMRQAGLLDRDVAIKPLFETPTGIDLSP